MAKLAYKFDWRGMKNTMIISIAKNNHVRHMGRHASEAHLLAR